MNAADPPIRVAVRYDDFSNGSPDELDRFIVETIVTAGLAMTVAAVPMGDGPDESRRGPAGAPRPLTREKTEILRPHLSVRPGVAGGRIELAQHGLDHQPLGRDPRGRPAELAGLPFDEQFDRIARGLEILEGAAGLRPSTFVPPWNRYDEHTLVALLGLEFAVLSAGRDAPPPGTDLLAPDEMSLIPATLGWCELEHAVRDARLAGARRTIVALLHPYDFRELETPWSRLDRGEWADTVAWLAAQPDVRCLTLGELARSEEMGAERLAAHARYHASPVRRLVPEWATGSLERPLLYYPERDETRGLALRRAGTALGIHAMIAAACGASGWLVGLSVPRGGVQLGLRWVLITLALALGLRALRGDGPYFRGVAVTLAAVAFGAGAWLS